MRIAKLIALAGLIGGSFFLFTTANANASTVDNPTDADVPQDNTGDVIYMDVNNILSPSQIANFARAAGFTGDDLTVAVAVALAESRGNPTAYNPEVAAHTPVGLGSYGLWQIYLNKHREFAGQNLNDPDTNAKAAYSVYKAAGRTFHPWSTFKYNLYLSHMDVAQEAVNS